jgi:glycosyltransferase involved in cell wall biosynthesis
MPNNIAIIILVHNALKYTKICINSLKKTKLVNYKIVVINNGSNNETKSFLDNCKKIDILYHSDENLFFSQGNNLGVKLAPKECDHILLLNSDVEILDEYWLLNLLKNHKRGITAYGYVGGEPEKADGYCLLINRDLYQKYWLDESFPWWWSITKLQAELLNDDFSVQAIKNHEKIIKHYGGKSGDAYKKFNLTVKPEIINSWFNNKKIKIL